MKMTVFLASLSLCMLFIDSQGVANEMNAEITELEIRSFDGVILKGTLSVPKDPKAIAITVHGSFLQTRDGDLDGSKPWMFPQGAPKRRLFADIAKALAEKDMATYRYDKRASGESGGIYAETDMIVLAKDLITIVGTLREKFPGVPVGIIGQSEGTKTTMRAWQMGMRPEFIVLQGPAIDPLEVIFAFQKERAAKPFLEGKDQDLTNRFPYLTAFYKAYYQGDMLQKIKETDDTYYELRLGDWSARTNLAKYRQYGSDDAQILKTVTVPVLLVVGGEDGNVRPESIKEISTLQQKGEYPTVKVMVIAGLEHSFRPVKAGMSFVDIMKQPISPKYVEVLQEFCSHLVLDHK